MHLKVTKTEHLRTLSIDTRHHERSCGVHDHDEGQLVYAPSGFVNIVLHSEQLTATADQLVWVPPHLLHRAQIASDTQSRGIYIPERFVSKKRAKPRLLTMTPLLREMMRYVIERSEAGAISLSLQNALHEQIMEAPEQFLNVVMPTDKRAAFVAGEIVKAPSNTDSLADWGKKVGASTRTLMRLFAKETGCSFREWRSLVRVRTANEMISSGSSITDAAFAVGYESLSAFNRARQLFA